MAEWGKMCSRAFRYLDSCGAKRVVGRAGLKQTELYTPEFGRGLAAWWVENAPITSGTEACVIFSDIDIL